MKFANRKLATDVFEPSVWTKGGCAALVLVMWISFIAGAMINDFSLGAVIASVISLAVFSLVLLVICNQKIVLDDEGLHFKGLFRFINRSVGWAQIRGCRTEKRRTQHGERIVIVVEMRSGRPVEIGVLDGTDATRISSAILDHLQIGWREGKKCSRCMQDLRQDEPGATACSKCSEDLTRDEMNWIHEYHRRRSSRPQA